MFKGLYGALMAVKTPQLFTASKGSDTSHTSFINYDFASSVNLICTVTHKLVPMYSAAT